MQGGDKSTQLVEEMGLKPGWKTINLKVFEIKEEGNVKKFSLIPNEEGA